MRRFIGATIAASILALAIAAGGASADPLNKPAYVVNCVDGTSYNIVSGDHAASGQDVNSTTVLVLVHQGVPLRKLTFCTATLVDTGESISGYFLITPGR